MLNNINKQDNINLTSKPKFIDIGITIFTFFFLTFFLFFTSIIFNLIFRSFNNTNLIVTSIIYFVSIYILKYIIKSQTTFSFAEYIALKKVPIKKIPIWFIIPFLIMIVRAIVQIFFLDIKYHIIEQRILDYNMKSVFLPLLFLGSAFLAPIYEEIMCRGFLFTGIQKGIKNTRWGNIWAIIITASFWAVLHFHYIPTEICKTFIMGCFLGACRLQTKSILLPIIFHIFINFTKITFLCFYL